MIEINLLPGAGRKSRARGTGRNFSAILSDASASVRDPILIGAIAATAIALLGTAGLFLTQRSRVDALQSREQAAVQDSTRYATVIKSRRSAQAQRDSVVRQLNIIRSIDNDRYVWPHILDEVSRALPAYTWLVNVRQTSTPPTAASLEAPADTSKKGGAAASPDTAVRPKGPTLRIIGNTVDIQALTRFIRELEQSPFLQNVQLQGTQGVNVEGQELTQFTLDLDFEPPAASAIRSVPVAISVR